MPDASAFVDEVANELATWPGVRIEPRPDGVSVAYYRHAELGLLYPDRGQKAKAVEMYEKALQVFPDFAEASDGLKREKTW